MVSLNETGRETAIDCGPGLPAAGMRAAVNADCRQQLRTREPRPMKLALTQKASRNRQRARDKEEASQPGWLASRTEAQEAADYRAELKRLTKEANRSNKAKRKKARNAKYRVVVLS